MLHKKTEDIELRLLLEAIFLKYHYDFRGYSLASIKRRLILAKDRFNCKSFSQLQDMVLHDEHLFTSLISFLTVQVSEMFRDPHYFKTIRERIIPHLRTYPSIKVWIAGCSNGEEVYSFAILFREEGLENKTMFYATDINADALRKAQAGVYELERIQLFTKNHQLSGGKSSLSDYYTVAYNNATFDKTLCKRVVFSDHSLASDAVFAEAHFISCRNVLIYFDRELQDRAVGLFKDSLVRSGFLGLGAKENLRFNKYMPAFEDFAGPDRIYQRRAT
jgi:chemotaxis protein methyltransferase CheR